MPDRLVTATRALLDRIFPRGAILLSVLSLAYFATGIVRNRVFANTYGASAELDAYNAAFRIPEIALDVLVAAGLTAPFVPIYSRLRHDEGDDRSANDFGRTVLTGAVGVMTLASIAIFLAAPWLAGVIGEGFDPATADLYVQLLRINCLAQILFAASIALGEILVANRRFLFYALAPILYTTGIIVFTVLFADRFGVVASAWGAVAGAAAHLAIRAIGTTRTSFRIRPAFEVRTAAFREFLRLMFPRMFSVAIEPLIFTYFTTVAVGLGVGARVRAQLRPRLPGRCRSASSASSFSLAVFPVLSAAFADGDGRPFRAVLGRNLVTIGAPDDARRHRPVRPVGHPGRGPARRRQVRCRGRRPDVGRSWRPSRSRSRSTPWPTRSRAGCTRRTTRSARSSPRSPGWASSSSPRRSSSPAFGILAIPLGYAAGMIVKDALLAIFLASRVARIGRQSRHLDASGRAR